VLLSEALSMAEPRRLPDRDVRALNADDDDCFARALALYGKRNWASAFGLLAALSDRSHVRASKLALLMLRHETTVFAARFEATPRQVARWAQCVLRANSRATAWPSSMTAMA
jgi:hypothetical protein